MARLDDSNKPESLSVVPALAGLAVSAVVADLLVGVFRPSGVPLILVATVDVLLTLAANILGIHVTGNVLGRNVEGLARRTNGTALWMAPAAVYLRAGSIGVVPSVAFVAGSAAALLSSMKSPNEATVERRRALFELPPPPPLTRLIPYFCAALCLQLAVASSAETDAVLAAALAGAGAAIVSWCAVDRGMAFAPTAKRRNFVSSSLTLLLALLLTTGAMTPGDGGGGGDGRSDLDDKLRAALQGHNGNYWGVFLTPTPPPDSKPLVEPHAGSLFANGLRISVRIPFEGDYWFFKSPDVEPPSFAVHANGSPDKVRFRSVDSTPLFMEAHQKLLAPINTTDCGEIAVEFRNADMGSGVRMEVLLKNSSLPVESMLSLGEVAVPAALPFQVTGNKPGIVGTLHFPLPDAASIPSFDEIAIRFHMSPLRETVSPKIAIENFILSPRG